MITLGDIQGHWQRRWIKAPGFEDETTRVHWTQAGCDYADLRIPLERPDPEGAKCLADFSAASLCHLARAEGFAGRVTLEGTTCTWHREINLHGTPEAPDVGSISFDDDGNMIEAGVHADYSELWEQRANDKPHAYRFSNALYSGVLVVAGEKAVLGIGQASRPSSKPLLDDLSNGRKPNGLSGLFDGLHALCRVENRCVTAVLATNPFVEGQVIARLDDDALVWHRVGFDGDMSTLDMTFETVSA